MIEKFLNIRGSTRALSDEQFEKILPQLAQELSLINYNYQHSYTDLKKDWDKLTSFSTNDNFINSTSRIGLKWCESRMPHFWDVETKGKSFSQLWKNTSILEKVLRWNRKSHSTPYLSELRRGIYFCAGLTKVTMYRPQMAKMIVDYYKAKNVLDPCAGWGGRMLGAVAAGAQYTCFDPCINTATELKGISWDLHSLTRIKPEVFRDGVENITRYIPPINAFDLILSSPPYFNLEIYDKEESQSVWGYSSYEEWRDTWYFGVIKTLYNDYLKQGGTFCWNIADFNKKPFISDTFKFMEKLGAAVDTTFYVRSSRRQSNQSGQNPAKFGQDTTYCWKKP
jgi:hypothetical protein